MMLGLVATEQREDAMDALKAVGPRVSMATRENAGFMWKNGGFI